jgi:hypothetical protein
MSSAALATEWRQAREATYQLRPSSCTLREFIEDGWHEVEPALRFIPNWHIDAIAEHLEAASRGEIQRLVISIPPGHAKSIIVAVMWPAWVWTWNPHWRSIFGSHDLTLSMRDSVRARTLMESDWYQTTFRPSWQFTSDQNVKSYYRNTKKGERLAISVAAAAERASAATLWWSTIRSRSLTDSQNDNGVGDRLVGQDHVVALQRAGESTPRDHRAAHRGRRSHRSRAEAGRIRTSLPALRVRSEAPAVTSLGVADPRTKEGELLFPQLFPPGVIDQAKKDLGSIDYAAQHQQSPVPMSGGIFQREWFEKHYYTKLPPVFHEIIDSWDMSFKDQKSSDYVVGQRWGRLGADVYLLRERRGQMNYPTTRKEVKAFSEAPTHSATDPRSSIRRHS